MLHLVSDIKCCVSENNLDEELVLYNFSSVPFPKKHYKVLKLDICRVPQGPEDRYIYITEGGEIYVFIHHVVCMYTCYYFPILTVYQFDLLALLCCSSLSAILAHGDENALSQQ